MPLLTTWTIYDHPADFPGCYVAREWAIVGGGQIMATGSLIQSDDVETIRQSLLVDMGLTCLGRSDEDDPTIVETWI